MGRVQVFKNPRVRDEAIIRPAICDISVLCVSATPSRWGLGASDGANDTPAERDDGLADVSGSLPESTPRAGRRLQGRRQGAGGVANGDSQALRRASPRATVSSPEEPRLAESRAHPVPPCAPRQESAHLGPEEAKKKIAEGVEAESFIRLHVVQAVGNERGNYEMRVEPQHVDGEYEVPGDAPGGCSGTGSK